MRIAHVSYFFDREIRTPDDLLDRYETLTGVAEGIVAAGADVQVVQRFHTDARVDRNGIEYRFVRGHCLHPGSLLDPATRVNQAVAAVSPDVVHAHGLPFARQAARLRRFLPLTPLLIQDHANRPPSHTVAVSSLRRAFESIQMVTFTSVEQATPWVERGIIGGNTIVGELMEGSSHFRPLDRVIARRNTGLDGDPLCLWVGRMDPNKDPLTALEGFSRAMPGLRNPKLVMVFREAPLLRAVETWLAVNASTAERVRLVGAVDHDRLEDLYNSADLYLSASRREGSGYAVLEALACAVMPVVTDIPSFRVLTDCGRVGALWTPGDPGSCADAIHHTYAQGSRLDRTRIRDHFDANFSFQAIGHRAVELYSRLVTRSHSAARA